MPLLRGPRSGLDCSLYLSETFSSPAPTRVLISEAIDVQVTINKAKIETLSRATLWNAKLPGIRDISMTFGYNYQGDPSDSVFTTIRNAFLNDTVLIFWVMDNVVASPGPAGSQGFAFPAYIFDFPIDQSLQSSVRVDIGVDFARYKENNVLINPSWFVVAPTP